MDVHFFLKMRTQFIRRFYDDAAFPFTERKRKIEAGEEPFVPPYSEDGDPPFEIEWIDADESLDVLGQACISMLAATLQLYFKEWVDEIHGRFGNDQLARFGIGRPDKAAFKEGWISRYRAFFQDKLRIDWTGVPSNLGILEEIVLTRNRAQHPERITSFRIDQSQRDAMKYPRSFFADDLELKVFGDTTEVPSEWVRPWRLNVTREKLFAAVDEVERFCAWLEQHLLAWPRHVGDEPKGAAQQ